MKKKEPEVDHVLIADLERLSDGAHVHWINATLHRYHNGDQKAEEALRKFVSNNGKMKKMTPEQLRGLWDKLRYPPENLPAALEKLEKDPTEV